MVDMREIHISLDEEAFNTLIRGEPAAVVTPSGTTVHVLLNDIGYKRMLTLVAQAMAESPGDSELRVWAQAFGGKKSEDA